MQCKCGNETVLIRGGNDTRCNRCNRERMLGDCLNNLQVPKVFHSARLEDIPAFKRKESEGLFICGEAGTGKTHLAVALLVEDILSTPMNRSLNCDFISMINLLSRIKSTFSKTSTETEEDLIGHFCNIPNLYIDDIGVEHATEWALVRVYQVIDYRWSNQLRTVFTSNFNLNALADKLDPRISSRISGMCSVVNLGGKDRRRRK